jgi:hypothetical protein
MRTLRATIITTVVLAMGIVLAPPASAALDGTIDSIEVIGCYLYVTVTVEDAGTYAVNAWDDGTFRNGTEQELEQGATATFPIHLQFPILQGAAGIGIYLEDAVGPAAVTTYDSNGSYNDPEAVANADVCGTNEGTDSGDPPGATIDEVLVDGCNATVQVTSTGLGEYNLLALDGETVLDEDPLDLNSGERVWVEFNTTPYFSAEVEFVVESADGSDEFATSTAQITCGTPPTTAPTSAPAVVPVAVAQPAAATTVTPAFTG